MWSVLQSSFHVATVFLLSLVPNSKALTHATYNRNAIGQDFSSFPTPFGPPLPCQGPMGSLIELTPVNACHHIKCPPAPSNSSTAFIVLIGCYDCTFCVKLLQAQQFGYPDTLVHNMNSQALVDMVMGMEEIWQQFVTPSVFTVEATTKLLRKVYHSDARAHIILVPEYYHVTLEKEAGNSCPCACRCRLQLLGHCSHVPIPLLCRSVSILVVVVMGILLIMKHIRGYHIWRRRRNLLREEQGKDSSPSMFNKGAKYTECAICLEKYEKGDLLKILSCSHAYHGKCIDLWLLTQARNKTCPLCMQRVIVAAESPDLDMDGCTEEEEMAEGSREEEAVYNREWQ
ncbi:E3 ubiquitin-protein ligase RNF167-like [Carettochelys insculpta]|uniref:E3 ubiquitin-protein ligase RNF167-like n=1 Tax=Carettochelys insculpta TaxID=44489 RepID=UPI003EB9C5E5